MMSRQSFMRLSLSATFSGLGGLFRKSGLRNWIKKGKSIIWEVTEADIALSFYYSIRERFQIELENW